MVDWPLRSKEKKKPVTYDGLPIRISIQYLQIVLIEFNSVQISIHIYMFENSFFFFFLFFWKKKNKQLFWNLHFTWRFFFSFLSKTKMDDVKLFLIKKKNCVMNYWTIESFKFNLYKFDLDVQFSQVLEHSKVLDLHFSK